MHPRGTRPRPLLEISTTMLLLGVGRTLPAVTASPPAQAMGPSDLLAGCAPGKMDGCQWAGPALSFTTTERKGCEVEAGRSLWLQWEVDVSLRR